jgi:enoyl-CoA hydratase/carnithine racemase
MSDVVYTSPTERVNTWLEGSTLFIEFNNVARHNALSVDMWEAVPVLLNQAEHDARVRLVVFTGAGEKAFVSGADISEFANQRDSAQATLKYDAISSKGRLALKNMKKPTIAMINGYCVGGGVAVALNCDIRIASENSKFAVPAAKLGLGYEYDGIRKLVDIVGPSFAQEIFFTARQFTAQEALNMGLINRMIPVDSLEQYVRQYADMITANAPMTIASIKTIVGEIVKDETKRDIELCDRVFAACFESEDFKEGRTAFMAKRKPVFKGR